MTKRTITPKMCWRMQRQSAQRRGIEFLFTFEEWVKWWEGNLGPDWMEKRGRHNGQYQMARNGDKGPYVGWNVKCLLAEDNNRQRAAAKGVKHGMARLTTEQVQAIFMAQDACAWELARDYSVSHVMIRLIRGGQSWGHTTRDLHPGAGYDCYLNGHKCRRGLSRP